MAKSIKFEIIAKWPEVRGIDVHYYTDELMAAIQPVWVREGAMLRALYSQLTTSEVQDRLVRGWPAGKILHLTIPKTIQTPQDLQAYILNRSPYDDVMTKDECLTTLPDMSFVDELMGLQVQGVPDFVLIAEAEASLAEPPIPIL